MYRKATYYSFILKSYSYNVDEIDTWGQFHNNILHEASTCADPKSVKKTNRLTVFFVLCGSLHAKAAHKVLVKLTPRS